MGEPEVREIAPGPHGVDPWHRESYRSLDVALLRGEGAAELGAEVFEADCEDDVVLAGSDGDGCLTDGGRAARADVLDVGDRDPGDANVPGHSLPCVHSLVDVAEVRPVDRAGVDTGILDGGQ